MGESAYIKSWLSTPLFFSVDSLLFSQFCPFFSYSRILLSSKFHGATLPGNKKYLAEISPNKSCFDPKYRVNSSFGKNGGSLSLSKCGHESRNFRSIVSSIVVHFAPISVHIHPRQIDHDVLWCLKISTFWKLGMAPKTIPDPHFYGWFYFGEKSYIRKNTV